MLRLLSSSTTPLVAGRLDPLFFLPPPSEGAPNGLALGAPNAGIDAGVVGVATLASLAVVGDRASSSSGVTGESVVKPPPPYFVPAEMLDRRPVPYAVLGDAAGLDAGGRTSRQETNVFDAPREERAVPVDVVEKVGETGLVAAEADMEARAEEPEAVLQGVRTGGEESKEEQEGF